MKSGSIIVIGTIRNINIDKTDFHFHQKSSSTIKVEGTSL